MEGIVFLALRCFACQTFQVNQRTKSGKWKCRMCGEKQSIVKVWGRGAHAKDVRGLVMELSAAAGRGEDPTEIVGVIASRHKQNPNQEQSRQPRQSHPSYRQQVGQGPHLTQSFDGVQVAAGIVPGQVTCDPTYPNDEIMTTGAKRPDDTGGGAIRGRSEGFVHAALAPTGAESECKLNPFTNSSSRSSSNTEQGRSTSHETVEELLRSGRRSGHVSSGDWMSQPRDIAPDIYGRGVGGSGIDGVEESVGFGARVEFKSPWRHSPKAGASAPPASIVGKGSRWGAFASVSKSGGGMEQRQGWLEMDDQNEGDPNFVTSLPQDAPGRRRRYAKRTPSRDENREHLPETPTSREGFRSCSRRWPITAQEETDPDSVIDRIHFGAAPAKKMRIPEERNDHGHAPLGNHQFSRDRDCDSRGYYGNSSSHDQFKGSSVSNKHASEAPIGRGRRGFAGSLDRMCDVREAFPAGDVAVDKTCVSLSGAPALGAKASSRWSKFV